MKVTNTKISRLLYTHQHAINKCTGHALAYTISHWFSKSMSCDKTLANYIYLLQHLIVYSNLMYNYVAVNGLDSCLDVVHALHVLENQHTASLSIIH